jgi:cyanophycin synthetase
VPTYSELVELRTLDGPNLYFPRPAIKLTVGIPGWLRATTSRLERMAVEMGAPATLLSGEPGTEQRHRFTARIGAHVTRQVAHAAGTRLAVRGRPGPEADQIVIAFPWRQRGTAEAMAREVPGVLSDLLVTRRSLSRLAADAAVRVRARPPATPPRCRSRRSPSAP